MHTAFNTVRKKFILVGVCFGVLSSLLIGSAGAASTDPVHGGRLVTFHDRGQTKVILTRAQTIRDALNDANISVVNEDKVEPSLDESLVATDYTVNIYRARPVIVVDGAVRLKILTAAQTPEGITKDAGLTLHDEDKTTLSASSNIIADGAGEILTIDRAKQFTLSMYGSPVTAYSQAATVGEMLKEKGIHFGPSDVLAVNPNTPLTAGMTVAIWRNGVQTSTVDEEIPAPVRQVQDVDHPMGYHQVQDPGAPGKRSVTYEVVMQDGQVISRKEIQSVIITAPKEQVVVIGIGPPPGSHQDWMAQAGIAASDFGFVSYIVDHENGSWDPCKVQGGSINCSYSGSLGYGLVQATPGDKMVSAGADWRTNPIAQLKWATSYAVGRYGSWSAAYSYWITHHNW